MNDRDSFNSSNRTHGYGFIGHSLLNVDSLRLFVADQIRKMLTQEEEMAARKIMNLISAAGLFSCLVRGEELSAKYHSGKTSARDTIQAFCQELEKGIVRF